MSMCIWLCNYIGHGFKNKTIQHGNLHASCVGTYQHHDQPETGSSRKIPWICSCEKQVVDLTELRGGWNVACVYGKCISYNNICVHSAAITATTIHSWFARFEPEFVLNNQVTTCV